MQVLLEVSGNLVATAADVETSAVQQVAAGRGELLGLALWVMQESSLVRPGQQACMLGSGCLQSCTGCDSLSRQVVACLCPWSPKYAPASALLQQRASSMPLPQLTRPSLSLMLLCTVRG